MTLKGQTQDLKDFRGRNLNTKLKWAHFLIRGLPVMPKKDYRCPPSLSVCVFIRLSVLLSVSLSPNFHPFLQYGVTIWFNFFIRYWYLQDKRLDSNFRPIQNQIWPPGRHLGFLFLRIISRIIWSIDFTFILGICTYKMQVKFKFHADPKSNMAVRPPFWIFRFLTFSQEPFYLW